MGEEELERSEVEAVFETHRELGALLVSWAGIVGVNVAHALQGRGER